MFSAAFQTARKFTRPVICTAKHFNGQISCSLGTFIIINPEGWVLTAAHVLDNFVSAPIHDKQRLEYEQKKLELDEHQALPKNKREKKNIAVPTPSPSWIVRHAAWWCQDGASFQNFQADTFADIAIAKLENFDTSSITAYPVFKDPTGELSPGQSLCRLGFPFNSIQATFNEATGGFEMVNFSLPAMFPNDGIHTRIQTFVNPPRQARFIETSSPGIKGQSGGPLFDTKREIWGIQTKTSHLDLDFKPTANINGKAVVVTERQFMHVGLATHVQHVIDLFRQFNVPYQSA